MGCQQVSGPQQAGHLLPHPLLLLSAVVLRQPAPESWQRWLQLHHAGQQGKVDPLVVDRGVHICNPGPTDINKQGEPDTAMVRMVGGGGVEVECVMPSAFDVTKCQAAASWGSQVLVNFLFHPPSFKLKKRLVDKNSPMHSVRSLFNATLALQVLPSNNSLYISSAAA